MELLATTDWLVSKMEVGSDVANVRAALAKWPGGEGSAARKLTLFEDRLIVLALDALKQSALIQ
jgi:hypothetical protein